MTRLALAALAALWAAHKKLETKTVACPATPFSICFCEMGSFHVGCKLENHTDRNQAVTVPRALVDTGSEYTCIPSTILEKIGVQREKKDLVFTMANGQTITRSVGFAILRVEKHFTIDEVVFGEPGDMTLLGARTLEGLSLVVDSRKKKLVAAGPLPAA